jgi:ADP-ribose pyrophosphatase
METFAIPGVGGILEATQNGVRSILLQERCKPDAPDDYGLLEIPTGKIRAFENIFDCLRREVQEETGLEVLEIFGEGRSVIREYDRYQVLNYSPFAAVQNLKGTYPIIAQIFICTVQGRVKAHTDESRNLRWVALPELRRTLALEEERFYPMHIITLRKYLALYAAKPIERVGIDPASRRSRRYAYG